MNRILDPHHIWNVISIAWSKQCHPPTSPTTAPCRKIFRCRFHVKVSEVLPPIERRFEDIRRFPRISNDNPTIKSSSRTRRFGDLTRPIVETILYCKIQLRLSPKMSRSAAPATKSHPPTSPNTAPAMQNECHQWSASHMKRHFQCVEQVKSPSNFTKYCACHAKWMSSMICGRCETSFPMRGANKVALQPHQILRLSWNLEAQDFSGNSLKCFSQ